MQGSKDRKRDVGRCPTRGCFPSFGLPGPPQSSRRTRSTSRWRCESIGARAREVLLLSFKAIAVFSSITPIWKGNGGGWRLAHGYRPPCTTSVQQPVAHFSSSLFKGMSDKKGSGHEPCHKNLPRIDFTLKSTRPIRRMIVTIIPSPVFVPSWLAGADLSATYLVRVMLMAMASIPRDHKATKLGTASRRRGLRKILIPSRVDGLEVSKLRSTTRQNGVLGPVGIVADSNFH